MKRTLLLLPLLGLLWPLQASEQADPRVKTLLEKCKLAYELDKDNDYALPFDVGDERSQTVFVVSDTFAVGETEYREVVSLGAVFKKPLSAALAEKLLLASGESPLGAWKMVKDGDTRAIFFTVKVPANAAPNTWVKVIEGVAVQADAMEKELTGEDEN
ncbi:MAG: hypothetical protein HUU35_17025 [Armatimonadetes bacterium]|nr:hypothetical protein [Armatimonadota bacterium]